MKETALITGASSGIGRELAGVFAEKGHDLVLVARSEGKLNEIKANLGNRCHIHVRVIARDLIRENTAEDIFNQLKAEDIQIDYLINNAGIGDFGAFAEAQWQKQFDIIQLNILALMHLTRFFLPPMLERKRGGILNVASSEAFVPVAHQSVYAATKAFVLSFTEALAEENKNTGVTITALCPGLTDTGFFAAANLQSVPVFSR